MDHALKLNAALAARAFANDPFYAWLFPREATRVRKTTAVMALALRRARVQAIEGGLVAWHTPDDSPAALAWRELGVVAGLLPSVLGRVGRLRRFARAVGSARPPSHLHLELLAVEPTMSGRGLGRQLMEHVLALGQPVVLETTNPANIGLYQRFGFAVSTQVHEPGVPPAWTMLRA